jgi:ribosome biogenesis protein UTP30
MHSVILRKWKNIKSLHLKSLESLALPLYQSITETPLRIEGVKIESHSDKPEKKEVHDRDVKRNDFTKGRICDVRYMDHMLGDFSDGLFGGQKRNEVDLLDSLGNKTRDVDSLDGEKELTSILSSKKRIAHAEKPPGVKRKKA